MKKTIVLLIGALLALYGLIEINDAINVLIHMSGLTFGMIVMSLGIVLILTQR